MVTVPSFLLRRLYVKGSLRKVAEGVQFQLSNKLGSGYAKRLSPLLVDGNKVPIEDCFFYLDGNEVPFSDVSPKVPFTLAINRSTTIIIKNFPLGSGPHTITMGFEVAGLGALRFDFTDVPADG